MKTNIKKSLKLITLMISALLISFASAQTFSELYMRATPITVTSAKVYFVAGANTSSIGEIFYGGTEVNFTGMQVKQGETQIYQEAVNITNQAGSTKTITLTVQSTSGNLSAFNYVNVSIIDENGALKGNIYLTPSSTPGNTTSTQISMDQGKTWAVRWEISAATYAEPNTKLYVTIKLTVED
jgi:hypothetical protein